MIKTIQRFFTDTDFSKKKTFLKSLPLFTDLSDRELGLVLQSLHSKTYEEGEILFAENDIGRALFILESGRIELTKIDGDGRAQRLIVLGAGEFFGEMALLEQMPRSASAAALEKSHVHLLFRTKMEDLLHRHPRIGVSILRYLSQLLSGRLRRMTQDLTATVPDDARQKIS